MQSLNGAFWKEKQKERKPALASQKPLLFSGCLFVEEMMCKMQERDKNQPEILLWECTA